MNKIVVIDFETTGLSPACGDRATEVAAVVIEHDRIIDRFQSLMNAGVRIPRYIQELTGITDDMIRKSPPSSKVMTELAEFVGDMPLVAHNASFDSKFLDAEWSRIQHKRRQSFACSMLLSRRIYPHFSDHKLGSLIRRLKLPASGIYHRALADAEMTANLIIKIKSDLRQEYSLNSVPHEMLCILQKAPKSKVAISIKNACIKLGL